MKVLMEEPPQGFIPRRKMELIITNWIDDLNCGVIQCLRQNKG